MQIKKLFPFVILFAIATFALPIATAQATVILIVSGGQLTGAQNVDLGGLGLFDVEFVEGTCIALFTGCDEPSDFDFTNATDAETASNALAATVFIDDGVDREFNSQPDLTFGCEEPGVCAIMIPYEVDANPLFFNLAFVVNRDDASAFTLFSSLNASTDTTLDSDVVFARFTPVAVPEPASLALFGFGLLGLGLARRRRKTA